MTPFKKSNGFSLMELLIATAILGGVVFLAMNIFSSQSDLFKKSNIDSNISEAVFAMSQALSKIEGCEETFVKPGNIRPEGLGTEVNQISFNKQALAFQKDLQIGQTGASHAITVTKMVLQNYQLEASNRGVADFVVKIKTKDQKLHTRTFPIGVIVKDGLVIGCFDRKQPTLDCRGVWLECSATCDTGTQVYSVVSYEKNGGEMCPHTDKESRACNTHSCNEWVTSDWGTCAGGSGSWSYGPWGSCEGGRAVSSSGCIGCGMAGDGACEASGGEPICSVSCSWLGTKSRTATCTTSLNSGSQTRTVNCQNKGAIVPDSKCSGAKPPATQQCTPTGESACGKKLATDADCPSTVKPNACA